MCKLEVLFVMRSDRSYCITLTYRFCNDCLESSANISGSATCPVCRTGFNVYEKERARDIQRQILRSTGYCSSCKRQVNNVLPLPLYFSLPLLLIVLRGHFPFTKKLRKFWLGCRWNTAFWFLPLEIFRNKRDI